MVTISAVQHTSSLLDVQGSRAYQAARAGAEWGIFQASGGICAGAQGLSLRDDLAPFTVTVTLAGTPYTESGVARTLCQITSTASSGAAGAVERVERQIQVIVDF